MWTYSNAFMPSYLQVMHPWIQPTADQKQAFSYITSQIFPITDQKYCFDRRMIESVNVKDKLYLSFGELSIYYMWIFYLVREHVASPKPCSAKGSTLFLI